jgi:DNA polymerase III alpha subunit
VREARAFGIDVLPPDVNESDEGFTIRGDAVRFGMKGIKGLGPAMVADVLNNRPFSSLEDMGARLTACNAAGRHALAQAGALDCFGARENLTARGARSRFEEDRIGAALSGEDKLASVREDLRGSSTRRRGRGRVQRAGAGGRRRDHPRARGGDQEQARCRRSS